MTMVRAPKDCGFSNRLGLKGSPIINYVGGWVRHGSGEPV